MKAILHIGPPKTGTTTIQAALANNREDFAKQSTYVFSGTKVSARALSTLYEKKGASLRPGLRRYFPSHEEAMAWSAESWAQLESDLKDSQAETAIISSEHFASIGQIDEFIARIGSLFDEVKIITYLRDPVSLYGSMISQQVRAGRRLRELKDPWRYQFPGIGKIQKYIDAFGLKNVAVRSFSRSNMVGGDLLADFFHTLNSQFDVDLTVKTKSENKNQSLCGAATAWLLTMNESFIIQPKVNDKQTAIRRNAIIQKLRTSEALAALPKFSISSEEFKNAILHNNRNKIITYNKTFLNSDSQLGLGKEFKTPPSPKEAQAKMADWILGYLTPEATQIIARELVL